MKAAILVFIICIMQFASYAQRIETKPAIAALIENQRFEFVAESANPMRGRTIFLSTGYNVIVTGDSLQSFLPYYGRAYQATLDPDEAGIKFTSTNYEYEVREKRKGWEISMKPNDVTLPPRFTISVTKTGTATLHAILADRQSISFSGYLKQIGKK